MASIDFINECKKPANCNRYGKLTITNGSVELNQSNYIQEFTIDDGCYDNGSIIGTVYCKKLNAQLINALDKTLVDKSFLTQVGVKYTVEVGGVEQEQTEYIDMGKYTIEKPKDELTDNYTSFVAYDDLANKIDKIYECNITYEGNSITLADLYSDVCYNLGLTPKTTTFINSTIPITANPFVNKETNRQVLQIISKIAASFIDIDVSNNKIDLSWLSSNANPDYTFYQSDYSTLNGGKVTYGPVNTLVIRSESVESENVSTSDAQSIAQYGEHKIIIADDYILNTPQLRQTALNNIWSRVHNLEYIDCELTTPYGKPFLKIGDKIRIYTGENEYFDTYILKHEFIFNGTFKSVMKSPAMTEQEIAIKQDISLGEKLNETSIMVNKQEKSIKQIVTSVGSNGEVTSASIMTAINNDTSQITLDADKIDLQGYITATDLSTSGRTTINGDNITTGKIKSANYVSRTSGTSIDLTNGAVEINEGANDVIKIGQGTYGVEVSAQVDASQKSIVSSTGISSVLGQNSSSIGINGIDYVAQNKTVFSVGSGSSTAPYGMLRIYKNGVKNIELDGDTGDIYQNGYKTIDMDSNSYGTYIKFANGLMICYRTINISKSSLSAWGSLYYAWDTTEWSFAQTFTSVPYVELTIIPQTSNGCWLGYADKPTITASSIKGIGLVRPTNVALNADVNIFAIGRWK